MTRTVRLAFVALSLLLAAVGSARADTTYLLSLQGTDQHYYPPCRLVDQPPPCDTTVTLGWTGALRVVVDTSADGVWSDADVRAFDFRTNIANLSLDFLPAGSVTVDDGRITAVDFGVYPGDDGNYFFQGLQASFIWDFDAPHEGSDFASGELTAVPEPTSLASMALALACAWGCARRSRRAAPRG